ncbi:MAG: hypothetical protein PUE30_04575 [Spirochaetia bacterium]|nr:hypothetical protein [Spirochaetia bacterium]
MKNFVKKGALASIQMISGGGYSDLAEIQEKPFCRTEKPLVLPRSADGNAFLFSRPSFLPAFYPLFNSFHLVSFSPFNFHAFFTILHFAEKNARLAGER